MTAHPALLAPPPPLADSTPEAPARAPEIDTSEHETDDVSAKTALAGTAEMLADIREAPHPSGSEPSEETDSSAAPKKEKLKDFHTQVSDLTFGPNHEKMGFDLKVFEQALVNQNILPVFAISDNTRAPLALALNTPKDKSQTTICHYRERYFEMKSEAYA